MKKFTFLWIMLFGLYNTINAQTLYCNNLVNVSLDGNGEAGLLPEFLLEGPNSDFVSFSLSTDLLTCNDLGLNVITVTGYTAGGDSATCMVDVYIEDKLDPIAYVYNGVVVILENDTYTLEVADLDAGSFDNCPNLSYTISPQVITCGMPNPVNVTFTVVDDSGNSAYATTSVYYEEDLGVPMICQADVFISFPPSTTYEVTVDDILEVYTGNCQDALWVELELNGSSLPTNILTPSMYGSTITGILHGSNGNACWANIYVSMLDCPDMLDTSMVDFPINVEISDADCDLLSQNLTPDYMINELGLDSSESIVQIDVSGTCLVPGFAYSDQVFVNPTSTKIIRTWTVIEWVHGTFIENVQVIDLIGTALFVCDTLPWNAPFGDCASGHTDLDAVEWPADVTISNSAYLPSQMVNASGINPNDAEPQVNPSICETIYVDYTDVFIDNTPDPMTIERTWNLFTFGGTLGSYTQVITVDYVSGDVYCAYRKNGDAIPDVIMAPGFSTDDTGCVDLSGYSGDIIEPSKAGDPADGLDLEDQLIMSKDILYIDPITCPFLKNAADINGNGAVTTLDMVLHQRIIDGLYTVDPVWSFFDVNAAPSLKNIILKSENNPFNTFVGVKKGDLNDSYDLDNLQGNPIPENDLLSKDQVLNNGQLYRVELYNQTDEDILGLNLSFLKDEGIRIKNIFAPSLIGFSNENFSNTEEGVTINYIPEDLNDPIRIDKNIPVLILILEAMENGILSERLHLVDDQKNLLVVVEDNTAKSIKLKWDNPILNKVDDVIETFTFNVYPNPTANYLFVKDIDQNEIISVEVTDMDGRILNISASETINVSHLDSGIYLIGVQKENGVKSYKTFIKI